MCHCCIRQILSGWIDHSEVVVEGEPGCPDLDVSVFPADHKVTISDHKLYANTGTNVMLI